ncbi:MAG: mechanosensitive ion channel domain-containing protein [Candidatus Thiodiazotropha sp.]
MPFLTIRKLAHPQIFRWLWLLLWMTVWLFATPVWAAKKPAEPVENTVTQEQIEIAKSELEADDSLDETQKSKVLDLLDQASNWIRQRAATQSDLEALRKRIREAPAEIKKLTAQSTPRETPDEAFGQLSLEELERRINQENLNLTDARAEQKQQLDNLARLLAGSQQINTDIAENSRNLDKLGSENGQADSNAPEALKRAQKLLQISKQQLYESKIELLKLRLANQSLLTNLAQAQRDASAARIEALQETLSRLNAAAGNLREQQAKQARQEAERLEQQTQTLPKPIQEIAQNNAQTRTELENLVIGEKQVADKLSATQNQLEQIRGDFEHIKKRVEFVGTSKAIGKMLIRRRQALPSLQSYSRSSAERRKEIDRATDRQIDIEESLLDWNNMSERLEQQIPLLSAGMPADQADHLKQTSYDLLGAQREALNELQQVYGRYISQLTALDQAERQLVEVSQSYVGFINDQLIWIPSGEPFDLLDLHQLSESLIWLISPSTWDDTLVDLLQAMKNRPDITLVILLVTIVLIWKRPAIKAKIPQLTKATRKIHTDSIRLTFYALLLTLAKVGLLPGLMIGVGYLLQILPTLSPISAYLSTALITVGTTLLGALMLYQVCLPDGIGIRHLRWNSAICTSLARELRWLIPIVVPMRVMAILTSGESLGPQSQLIDRLSVIGLLILTLVFVYRVLNKQSLFYQSWVKSRSQGLLIQTHFLWFPILLLIGLALLTAGIMGYLTLSLRLLERFELTFWFFLGLFTLKELLLRYLFIAERRLRYENALQRRDELRAQREQEANQTSDDEGSAIAVEIPELDFDALSEQAKRLVRFGYLFGSVIGTWLIWAELLPALDFFSTVQLPFTTSHMVDGIATEGNLTLSDLVIGLMIVVVTALAAKNLPGILEITLLQRLPLETGARYALTTMLQYLIVGIGVIMAFGSIGFQWSSIQWLVAALGVGLGFGLQEIVANFISGIILLFERPIRVGDVVTLDNTTGVVSRIRIRATTITNYDKQEMLIPNKEFITGRVINWTLTDKINRIIITVGVAYGTDVKRAMELLIQVAEETDNVLDDPKPTASFEAFGDSALTLLLRAYLGSMDNRIATITALHEGVYRKFSEHGIPIPFPQRDIHIINPQGFKDA